ncbi:MAG: hypothetical protein ACE5KK_01315 [Candidatus Brocadiales bacterium]
MPQKSRKTSTEKAKRPFTKRPKRFLTDTGSCLWFDLPALEEEVGRKIVVNQRVLNSMGKFMHYLDDAQYGYALKVIQMRRRRDMEAISRADEKRRGVVKVMAEMLRQPHPRTLATWAVANYDRIISLIPEGHREGAGRAIEEFYLFYTLKT